MVTEKGLRISTDILIDCTGVKKDSAVIAGISTEERDSLKAEDTATSYSIVWPYSSHGCVEVDEHLQVRHALWRIVEFAALE